MKHLEYSYELTQAYTHAHLLTHTGTHSHTHMPLMDIKTNIVYIRTLHDHGMYCFCWGLPKVDHDYSLTWSRGWALMHVAEISQLGKGEG